MPILCCFVSLHRLSGLDRSIMFVQVRSDKTDPAGQASTLMTVRNFVSRFSNVPGKFGLPGETCYWTSSYHCHVKLYEKLLLSVFDILEDGQIVEVCVVSPAGKQ